MVVSYGSVKEVIQRQIVRLGFRLRKKIDSIENKDFTEKGEMKINKDFYTKNEVDWAQVTNMETGEILLQLENVPIIDFTPNNRTINLELDVAEDVGKEIIETLSKK